MVWRKYKPIFGTASFIYLSIPFITSNMESPNLGLFKYGRILGKIRPRVFAFTNKGYPSGEANPYRRFLNPRASGLISA